MHCTASCKVRQRARESTNSKAHRKGEPRKKGPGPAKRRKSGEAKEQSVITHWPHCSELAGWLRDDPLQHFIWNTRNTQIRSSESKQLSVSKWSKFENWFSHAVPAILNAENL